MDQIDKTIIGKLREIDCPLGGITTLLDFDDETYAKAVLCCLRLVGVRASTTCDGLPESAVKRLQLSTRLAEHLRCELKYPHELSYQNLLYFELNDARKLFLFLIEKITKLRAHAFACASGDECGPVNVPNTVDELELQNMRERSQNEVSLLKNKLEKICQQKTKVESSLNAIMDEAKVKSHLSRVFVTDSDEQLENLKAITADDETRLSSLKTKWAANEAALLRKLEDLKTQNKKIAQEHVDNIEKTQSRLNAEKRLSAKKAILERAESYYRARMQGEHKAMNRELFTTQILEITKNIKKQTSEIEKIASDTRRLQKDLSQTEGQLMRVFTLFEHTIRQTTNRAMVQSRRVAAKSHQLLMNVHGKFEDIFGLIERVGRCERDILDLDEQIEREKRDNLTRKLSKAKDDLERFCAESGRVLC